MKKMILFLVFNCVFSHLVFSQENKIDSLETILKNKIDDTSKVKTLCSLSDELCDSKPAKAIIYAFKGLALASQISFKKGISICCNALGNAYSTIGNNDTAMIYYKKSCSIAFKMNDSLGIAAAYDNIGILYFQQGKIDSAIKLRNNAVKIYKSLNNEGRLANGYIWLGNIYNSMSQYTRALKYYLDALEILKKLDDPNIGFALVNIANIYRTTKEYDKAKQYALNAKARFSKLNNQYGIAASLYNLSLIYNDENNYQKAIELLLEAKKIVEKIDDKTSILGIYNLIGDTYRQLQDYKESLKYLNKALIISKQIKNVNQTANILGNIGSVYEMQEKYAKAVKYFLESKPILDSLEDLKNLKIDLKNLIVAYSHLNHPDSALKYFNLYQALTDTIYNEQNSNAIAEMQTKYETQQKADSISVEKKLIIVKNKSIDRQHQYLTGLISLLVLIFCLFIFTFLQSKKLGRQYNKIQQLQSELTHRTGNFFSSIKSMLATAKSTSADRETFSSVEERVNTINHLFKSLYSSPKNIQIKFSEMLASICNDLESSFGQQNNIKVYLKSQITPGKDEAIPLAFIITELVTNCYKHAFNTNTKNGEIHINIFEENKARVLDVWDNGDGLAEDELANTGTQGMSIIKSYCKSLNGKFNYWNDKGVHFNLKF